MKRTVYFISQVCIISFALINISGYGNKYNQIDTLILLSEKYLQINKNQSIEYSEKALELSRKSKDKQKIANSLNNLAGIYYNISDYSKAIQLYNESVEIYEELKDLNGIAKTKNNTGVINLTIGNLSEAYLNFQAALDIFRELHNPEGESSCLNNLGLIKQKQEDYKSSLNYFNKALSIKTKLENEYSIKQTLFNIGTSFYYLSEFDSSAYYLNKCLNIERKLNDKHGISITLNSLGMLELVKGNADKALDFFLESLQIGRLLNDKESLIQNWNNIGIVSLVNNDYEKAANYFDSSLDLAIELNIVNKIKENYKSLSEVLEKQEKYREALDSYQFYTLMANQMIDEQKRTINIENEYKLLETEKEKQKQKTYVIALIAILILLIISIIFIIKHRQLKYKSAIEKTIAEQEKLRYSAVIEASEHERKRIAGDLHDSISYMLSTAKLNMSGLEDDLKSKKGFDKELLFNSLKLIDEACTEVRNISHNLMPGALTKLGLIPALKDLVRKTNQSHQIKIKFEKVELNERLEESIEIALYRIIQELINNILKHADASAAELKIESKSDILTVTVKDNGKGFNTEILKLNSGIGWKNIYSRAEMIGGKVNIESKKGNGTKIKINVPFHNYSPLDDSPSR